MLGMPQAGHVSTLRAGLAGDAAAYLHDESKYPAPATAAAAGERHGDLDALLRCRCAAPKGSWCRSASW